MSKIAAFIIAVAAMAATAYVAPAHAAQADAGMAHVEALAKEADAVRAMNLAQRKAWSLRWAERISKERNEHNRYALVLDLLSIQHQALED